MSCHLNAFYLICMRRMHAMDRNIEPESRRTLVNAIDMIRHNHERKAGCRCWDEAELQMDTPRKINLVVKEEKVSA